ncbi:MAG: CBS domain-containing protein [Candidatus Aenigmatarchaeota archaeon]
MKKVKDYMHKKIICFKPEDSIFKVAKVLSKKHISGAPVVKNKKVIGMISETDIIKFLHINLPGNDTLTHEPHILSLLLMNLIRDRLKFKQEVKKISKVKVKDFMTKLVISISPEASLLEAAELMEKYDITRLPVIENGKLKGIISKSDLIRALID